VAVYGTFPKADGMGGDVPRPESFTFILPSSWQPGVGNDGDIAELEDILNGGDPEKDFCCISGPFLFSQGDLEFLPLAEGREGDMGDKASATVILEKNGVHYIDDDACNCDAGAKEKLDSNFVDLVESVVFNRGLPRPSC